MEGWTIRTTASEFSEVTAEHRSAAHEVRANLDARFFDLRLHNSLVAMQIQRALDSSSVSTGGALIAENFADAFELALNMVDPIRRFATVDRDDSGADQPFPTVDDTSQKGERLSDTAARTTQDVVFSVSTFRYFNYSSKRIIFPRGLGEDAPLLQRLLAQAAADRIGRIQNEDFSSAAGGSSDPDGILSVCSVGHTTASASSITADELIELVHSVDAAYRESPSCIFMMRDATLKSLRKLKDSSSRYLLKRTSEGERLLGYPVVVNPEVPAIASDAKTIAFGDFSKYRIRDAGTMRIMNTSEDRAEYNEIVFLATLRSDGRLVDGGGGAIKLLQQAT